MVVALTLLVFGLTHVPAIELLPWHAVAYLLVGACIFGPLRKMPSLRQAVAFLLPGVLLVVLALLNLGFWCASPGKSTAKYSAVLQHLTSPTSGPSGSNSGSRCNKQPNNSTSPPNLSRLELGIARNDHVAQTYRQWLPNRSSSQAREMVPLKRARRSH